MIHLCLVIQSLGPGGAEKVISVLANTWAEKGWPVTLLTLDNGMEPSFFPLNPAIKNVALGLPAGESSGLKAIWRNLRRVLLLRRALKRIAAEAVISFIDRTNVAALLAGAGLGLPVLVAERTDPAMLHSGKLWNFLCRLTYPLAARVVVQSPEAADYYSHYLRRTPAIIPNPVLYPEPVTTDSFRLKRPSVVAIGRFTREKGFDLLLGAFARIAARHPDWVLTILGDGPLRLKLEEQCHVLDLKDRVVMPGVIASVSAVLQQADLFVLPRFEGFPNALCEAMACGVAVIATDCPSGPRQIVRNNVDGLLVPSEDVKAMAEAMDGLMLNETERNRLGQRAMDVAERFSVPKVVDMWEDELEEAVG
jgi:glycosyltransferase involved in cell wall biosynthesis